MPDIDSLVTHLPKDKGYTGESPAKGGLPGFVCPRADAYGGREGIIAPGVAAVNGLVPRSMRRISTADTAKAANEARTDGRTESERYREYYGAGAAPAPAPAPSAPKAARAVKTSRAVQPVRAARAAQAVATQRRLPAAPSVAPAVIDGVPAAQTGRRASGAAAGPRRSVWLMQATVGGRVVPGRMVPGRMVPGRTVRRPAPVPAEQVLRDVDDPGVFSRAVAPGADDDTLDGFYDSLGGPAPGTGEEDIGGENPAFSAGEDTGFGEAEAGAGAPVPRQPRARETDPDVAGGSTPGEKAALQELASLLGSAQAEAAELRRQLEDYKVRDAHYANIERELAGEIEKLRGQVAGQSGAPSAMQPAETVRVALAVPEERLKVGGVGRRREDLWECRVMGALHVGRGGTSAVLTLSDAAYASDLLADIRPGRVVILSESKRTSCVYSGHCVKIYGEPDSQDFIAAFFLQVEGSEPVG